jgi:hypothetical protein
MTAIPRLGWLCLSLTGCMLLLGCGAKVEQETWSAETIYFFYDRSDAQLEHLYVFWDGAAFAQVCIFPGYRERQWYTCPAILDELMEHIRAWATRPGDLSPPFEPHGPWYSRISLKPDSTEQRGEAWFRDDNRKVQAWFGTLRESFVQDAYRTNKLPDWLERNERARKHLGLFDTPMK